MKGLLSNGDTWSYEGFVRQNSNKSHGTGVCTYSNGDVAAGEWRDDKQDGRGKYMWSDGGVYEGEYKNGRREGYGTMIHANGDRQSGVWRRDDFLG
jgi:1-phosphatidylinositol-4-phosphate 5-kinase